MSNPVVREAFRDAWSTKLPSLQYYDTINVKPPAAPLPDVWATMLFADPVKVRISIGSALSCYRETGTVGVVVMTKTGTTDSAASQQAILINNAFINFVAAGGFLHVVGIQPMKDVSNDTPIKSDYNKTVVEIDYSFDSYE
jgi:hypothetical protein